MAGLTISDRSVVAGELLPDEELLWVGRPDPSRHFTTADWFLVPFSLLFLGFAIFWELAALGMLWGGDGAPIFFALWGIPFILIGLYVAFGRFVVKARRKLRTWYALTDRRALVVYQDRRGRSTNAAYLETLPNVMASVRPDGSGSVVLTDPFPYPWAHFYANTGWDFFGTGLSRGVAFYDIPDARRVLDLLTQLRLNRR